MPPETNKLHAYLRRIDYGGPLSPTRQTLHNLHRAHLLAVPFENVEVQFRRVPSLDLDRIYEKIVVAKHGGWCFEMNALFAWALREIGFTVDIVGASVEREKHPSRARTNHMVLIVRLDQPFLADVGFGNGPLIPLPLRPGSYNDTRFEFHLTRDGEWWRFHNHRYDGTTYDFLETPLQVEDFREENQWLATSADSYFVQNLVCARLTDDGIVKLTNALLEHTTTSAIKEEAAVSADALQRILRERFGLEVVRISELWDRVSAEHRAMLRKRIRGF